MKGRPSIARCVLNSPDLMFLDEPTGGLDPVSAQRVKDIIRAERNGGAAVFLTTHDRAADELCDCVAFVVDRRIAVIKSPRALKLQHGERTVRVEYRVGDGVRHTDYPLDGLADKRRSIRSA